MFCVYCGTSLPDDAVFCNKCGKQQKMGLNASTHEKPAAESSFPGAAQATSESNVPHELRRYLEYMAAHQGIKATRHTPATATHAAEPPALFNSLPQGDVFLYPDFLIFLTLTEGAAGTGMFMKFMGKGMVEEVRGMITLHKWAVHPASFFTDIAKSFLTSKYNSQEVLEKALSNPNSIFIPLGFLHTLGEARLLSNTV